MPSHNEHPTHHSHTIPQVVALSVVAAFIGSAFATPATAVTPEQSEAQAAIVMPASTTATDLTRMAEDEILTKNLGIDPNSSVVGLVDEQGAVTQTKRENITTLNPGWVTPVKKFGISAVYGQAGGWSSGHHTGLDFTAPEGTTVLAAHDGKVVSSQYEGAYGNLIQIRGTDGISTWYAHLSSAKVKKGDVVKAGDKIGAVGMTGNTSGPHLHFEVRKGKDKHMNPAHYIWKSKKFPKGVKRG